MSKKLTGLAAVAAAVLGSVAFAGTAHASGSECGGNSTVAGAEFILCTYVDNSGGDGLYINYANAYINTSNDWTFPSGDNCLVQPALTLWKSPSGFSTVTSPNQSCNTFKSAGASHTFSLHQEQPANEVEVCATLFFPQYNQRVGYTDDCVGVHK
ncbi:hypothetical protein ABZ832_15125 [Streptantibioticus parmotrematis]|uniref:hypothetical protein n=1 Tax=Streptantibioticus parmotrematis TaxID=2873249 RepID=UPI0033FD3DF6